MVRRASDYSQHRTGGAIENGCCQLEDVDRFALPEPAFDEPRQAPRRQCGLPDVASARGNLMRARREAQCVAQPYCQHLRVSENATQNDAAIDKVFHRASRSSRSIATISKPRRRLNRLRAEGGRARTTRRNDYDARACAGARWHQLRHGLVAIGHNDFLAALRTVFHVAANLGLELGDAGLHVYQCTSMDI